MIGAAKCGTTTIADWLSQHPDFCVSNPKEPKFFTRAEPYIQGPEKYVNEHFSHFEDEKWVIDCRPQNMIVGFTPARIKQTCGDINAFTVCLRDPVERVYSAWRHFSRMRPGREPRSFRHVVEENIRICDINWADYEGDYEMQSDPRGGTYRMTYIEASMYWEQLQKFMKEFEDSDYNFVLLDEIKRSPESVWFDVCNFYMVDPVKIKFNKKNVSPHKNDNDEIGSHEWLLKEHRTEVEMMKEHFFDGLCKLSDYMMRDLVKEWWNE